MILASKFFIPMLFADTVRTLEENYCKSSSARSRSLVKRMDGVMIAAGFAVFANGLQGPQSLFAGS